MPVVFIGCAAIWFNTGFTVFVSGCIFHIWCYIGICVGFLAALALNIIPRQCSRLRRRPVHPSAGICIVCIAVPRKCNTTVNIKVFEHIGCWYTRIWICFFVWITLFCCFRVRKVILCRTYEMSCDSAEIIGCHLNIVWCEIVAVAGWIVICIAVCEITSNKIIVYILAGRNICCIICNLAILGYKLIVLLSCDINNGAVTGRKIVKIHTRNIIIFKISRVCWFVCCEVWHTAAEMVCHKDIFACWIKLIYLRTFKLAWIVWIGKWCRLTVRSVCTLWSCINDFWFILIFVPQIVQWAVICNIAVDIAECICG